MYFQRTDSNSLYYCINIIYVKVSQSTTHQGFLKKNCDGLQEMLDFDLDKLGNIQRRQNVIGYTGTVKIIMEI